MQQQLLLLLLLLPLVLNAMDLSQHRVSQLRAPELMESSLCRGLHGTAGARVIYQLIFGGGIGPWRPMATTRQPGKVSKAVAAAPAVSAVTWRELVPFATAGQAFARICGVFGIANPLCKPSAAVGILQQKAREPSNSNLNIATTAQLCSGNSAHITAHLERAIGLFGTILTATGPRSPAWYLEKRWPST